MLCLAMTWRYSSENVKYRETLLLYSIHYCDEYVNNYVTLGRLYLELDRYDDAKTNLYRALSNVKNIYEYDNAVRDITNIETFFNEHYRGTYMTAKNLENIRKLLDAATI